MKYLAFDNRGFLQCSDQVVGLLVTHLVLANQLSGNEMVHGGISGPHTGGDPPQAEQEGEDHVADHRLPDLQVLATLAPGDGGLEQHGHLVRPGQLDVLLPPALHHQGDVES